MSSDIHGLPAISADVPGTTRLLRIKVLTGKNLAKKDIFGASDPYVRISLFRGDRESGLIDCIHTSTKKKTLNPDWGEEFIFRVNSRDNVVLFEVFDSNRVTRDDFLGLVEITLNHMQIATERDDLNVVGKGYMLRPRSIRSRVKGQLWLYLAYLNDGESEMPEEEVAQQEAGWELLDGFSAINTEDTEPEIESAPATGTSDDFEATQSEALETGTTPLEPLPVGWEEKTDSNGRKFYVNHVLRTTQWQRPVENSNTEVAAVNRETNSTLDQSNQSLPLPTDWEERTDANGRSYYVNHNTRVTQWERPTVSTESSSAPEDSRSRVAAAYRQRRHISVEDTISLGPDQNSPHAARRLNFAQQERRTQSTTSLSSQHSTTDEEPLPVGWAMGTAPNGRIFYIDHNNGHTSWEDPRKLKHSASVRRSQGEASPSDGLYRPSSNEDLLKNLGPLPDGWEERSHSDGRVFYINHKARKTQWEDPRLQKLGGPAVPYSRDFKRKYDYFRSKLRKPTNVPNKIDIKVTRKNVFEDSYRNITSVKRSELLKTRLWIEFDGEVGLDYGGVAREWFYLLSKEMFNPYYGLFEYSATDNYTLQINPLSGVFSEDHLKYFYFVGRIAGMAVYHGKLLDAFFIRPFYKMMLDKRILLEDMESVDSEYYNSMCYIRDNDPEPLDLYFAIEEDYFGAVTERELKPGGQDILVKDENKLEYLNLVVKWRFMSRIDEQMKNFMKGFHELVPRGLLAIFDENELELLMCGLQDIDVNDWKANTAYKGEYNPNHPVIVHFWKAIYSFNNETRSRLLQFVTGTSRVPMNGFKELQGSNGPQLFTIEKWGSSDKFPRAHTCFNRIDLPPYDDYYDLRKKLITAIENAQGFEGVD